MNSPDKTTTIDHTSLQKAARIAGLMYFLIIITSLLSMIFGPYKLIVEGNVAATFKNIMDNELLFRIGTIYDLIMFASVVILSVALYAVLKTVNRNLALLGLLWRLGEAILGCLSVLSSLIILQLLKGKGFSLIFEFGQVQTLVGLFLDVSSAAISMVMVFLSLGTIINCYLFFKSKYIPRILAAFGIFSFLLVLIWSFLNILIPDFAETIQIVSSPMAILFEIVIGLWLLIKGVKVRS